MRIFKSFEEFNSQAVDFIKKKLVQFIHVEGSNFITNGVFLQAHINSREDKVQMYVYDNKLYNFLTSSWQRVTKKKQKNK